MANKESISFKNLKETIIGCTGDVKVSDQYLIASLDGNPDLHFMDKPTRFDGFIGFMCVKGSLRLELNLTEYTIMEGELFMYTPGTLFRTIQQGGLHNEYKLYLIACSNDFLSSIKMDFERIFEETLSLQNNPCIKVNKKQTKILASYYDLSLRLCEGSSKETKEAIQSLGSSIFYYIGAMLKQNVKESKKGNKEITVRSRAIFDKFLRLVAENHTRERNVSYYANVMMLTPKYLSKLVKKVSGQSAPDWIDYFVILAAKNMLKYSNMSIKEISFALNFNSLSVFYKFFKARTGITPKEYQES